MRNIFHKNAIALLITVFFIMVISLSVKIGLNYINKGRETIANEQFVFQNAMLVHDVLEMLKKLPELNEIETADDMSEILSKYGNISLPEIQGMRVNIKLLSARSKINPNAFNAKSLSVFEDFLTFKGIDRIYADFLSDSIDKLRKNQIYKTDIFTQKPTLFRDYIASEKHLEEINNFYINYLHDVNFKHLNIKEIFYVSHDANSSNKYTIDFNQATPLVYEVILGCDELRAQELRSNRPYETTKDIKLELSDEENKILDNFTYSSLEKFLDVHIELIQNTQSSKIRFEYDIKSKKASNFVFEI